MRRSAVPTCLALLPLLNVFQVPHATAQSPMPPETPTYVPEAGLAAVVIRPQPVIGYPDVMES